ncbi:MULTISPECIES: bifunctional 2-polyprenyl-6-hydroxyphenol methylase/3-demethylubiquinol 3-O-methyltransferase UbiG [unclassified Wenzhouxiangella]|uniref:class I SAM-dependent methyltransferase n=1 Tax=unclassified Wenzhouxiangella TaxID=2613841 RepID=UPI000E325A35|nr:MULTISPECIES: class I SAM-dependent methyltransferase [unclassified Wenzhouxiangella]RFF26525.1 class I SAM-dependent methyltransferase [Wenzhouxiangella sp. 15181]RFP67514.1 class I SAM-dependent methyltransferase [Wenzhouxiangella sp. 15190]
MSDQPELEFTGERFTPECVREMAYEHWHRYAWAAEMVKGLDALDAACGEGYGSHLLATRAKSVVGVDIGEAAVAHARERYSGDNLRFEQADATKLPCEDDRFDVVVSFETLEHLEAQETLLAEFRRVLRPDGFLVISSPDRKTYSDETGYDNPFHVRELYRDELESLISAVFPAYRFYGQKLMFVSALWDLDDGEGRQFLIEDEGTLRAAHAPDYPPLYYVVVAAAEPSSLPPVAGLSLYGDRGESVYQHYNDEVARHIQAGHLLAEREAEIERLRARLARPWWRRIFRRS